MIKKISRNFLFLSAGEMLSHFLGFIANAYIARTLGVDGFGLINYCLAFLTYLLLFNNVGLTTLGTRELAKDRNNTNSIGTVVSARLILTIFLYILFLVFMAIIPGEPLTKKIILLYLISGIPNALYLEFVFQAREEMQFISIGRIIQYAVYVVLIVIFLKTERQILAVPVSYLVAFILATICLMLVYYRKYAELKFSLNMADFLRILKTALPIGIATIIYQAVMNFPALCLGIFHSKVDVGFFSAGYKIIILLLIIERIFYYLLFPIFSRRAHQDKEIIRNTFIFFSQLVFGISLVIGATGVIFAENIIIYVYGIKFASAAIILRILLLYFIFAPLNTIWGYGLVALNQEKKFFMVIVITAVTNIVLMVILGYQFKGIGVAVAFLVSEFFGVILMKRKLNTTINFPIFKMLKKRELRAILTEKL